MYDTNLTKIRGKFSGNKVDVIDFLTLYFSNIDWFKKRKSKTYCLLITRGEKQNNILNKNLFMWTEYSSLLESLSVALCSIQDAMWLAGMAYDVIRCHG